MKKILEKLIALSQMRYARIITNGFISIAAISIAGSLFSLLKSIPFTFWQNFLSISGLGSILSIPISITTSCFAIYTAVSMGYQVGKEFEKDRFSTALIGFACFLLLIPFVTTATVMGRTGNVTGVIPTSATGAEGVFVALFAGIVGPRIYVAIVDKGWTIKMPDSVPDIVSKMFEMMIPGGIVFMLFLGIRYVFSLTSYETMQNFVFKWIQTPFINVGGGFWGLLIYSTFGWVFFAFGIHGGMVMYSAFASVMSVVNAENLAAFAEGVPIPHMEWGWANYLADCHILPLALCLLIFAKSDHLKKLSKIALPIAAFNISEPLTFGIPTVMNPIMALSLFFVAMVDCILTILVTKIGLLAPPTGASIAINFPGIIQAPLMNGSWTGAVWAFIIIVLDIFLYLPFVRIQDKKCCDEEQARLGELHQQSE